ncbi:MAG: FAD-dependent oxidoreductase [Alphaproteobacteria bacterium]|nr:FAD-dependent oxidoreductase [Alphaproteobacteria bacterium]
MERFMKYDLAVIGGGSAGLSVAAAAAQFGLSVVLFEKAEMGGDCLNTGCVPSKSLLAAAKVAHTQRHSAAYGITPIDPKVDFAKVMDHVQGVINKIAPHDSQERFERLGVKVVRAPARFINAHQLEAEGEVYVARKYVIATGSRAAVPAIPGLKDVPYFTTETIFKNRLLPKHLVVIGGGPVGLEMAQAYRRLGSQVTVLDAFQPLTKDDPELTSIVLQALQAEGIDIQAQVAITEIKNSKTGIDIIHKDGRVVSGSHLLVATGRQPNIESLNLEAAGVAFSKRGITVDQSLRSSNRKVYAAGDVAGGLQFTHVAGYHAGLIIRNALFKLPVKNRFDVIPWVTYTDPELAHVGLAELDARKTFGDSIKILRWNFSENDRAQAEGKTQGMIKVVLSKRGRIMGASIVGAQAGELIAPWVLALAKGLKISAFANVVLPYPTLSEISKRAAISSYAGMAQNPWLRRALGILKILG